MPEERQREQERDKERRRNLLMSSVRESKKERGKGGKILVTNNEGKATKFH